MSQGQGPFYPLGRGEEISEGAYQASQIDPPEWDESEVMAQGPETDADGWPTYLNAPEGRWQTKNDGVVLIRDMTDTHLRNAIRWMRARALDDHPKFDELIAERTRRGIREQ